LSTLTGNSITVGQAAERIRMLDVACSRCERRGRLSMSRLLLERGPDAPISHAWRGLNHDCPKRNAQGAGESCSLHAPILSKLFLPAQPG